jgi:serine protease
MNRKLIYFRLFLALLIVFSASGLLFAQGGDSQPPFKKGQVAVYAEPEMLAGFNVSKYLPNAGISIVEVESGREWGLIQRFRRSGLTAGLNLEAQAFGTVNDPYASFQWHFSAIQTPEAWDVSTGLGAVVAVLDSGLAPGGIDGIGCVLPGFNSVEPALAPIDGDGHGTHVSGTIAQKSDNGIGVAGVAYDACILPVKVLDDSGSGSFADIADGIAWATENGAQVINMSLGTNARFGLTSDPIMDPALEAARAAGITIVCASGNDGSRRNISYPAIHPATIAVGATDFNNQVTNYSNKGNGLDLVAPGGDVMADRNGDGYGDGVLQETFGPSGWSYYFYQGTSMASPHVAAVAALLYSQNSSITPDDVLQAITGSALDLNETGWDKTSGWGLVQAYDALNYTPDPGTGDGGGGSGCTDADGDGVCVEDGDCNDNNPSVFPGANDTRGKPGRDGVDNDCNGVIDG